VNLFTISEHGSTENNTQSMQAVLVYSMHEVNYNYFYCGVQLEGLLHNAERDPLVIAKFLVSFVCSWTNRILAVNPAAIDTAPS